MTKIVEIRSCSCNKKLLNTIQILCKLINVNYLLYTYANVMQQIDNLSCGVFTSICNKHCVWILSRKNSICFDTNANTFTKLHKQQIHISLPKIWILTNHDNDVWQITLHSYKTITYVESKFIARYIICNTKNAIYMFFFQITIIWPLLQLFCTWIHHHGINLMSQNYFKWFAQMFTTKWNFQQW
jgi:hypothetical protein